MKTKPEQTLSEPGIPATADPHFDTLRVALEAAQQAHEEKSARTQLLSPEGLRTAAKWAVVIPVRAYWFWHTRRRFLHMLKPVFEARETKDFQDAGKAA